MKKFHVILLAGGEKGPLFETTGYLEKALIPIRGKPMLSRVIEAFRACRRVDEIVVVGSSSLDTLEAMAHVRKRIFTGINVVQNLVHAVTYVKHRLYGGASDHNGYVISFCDAVFLTPEIIDDTLQAIEELDSDVVLHYVERSTFEEAGLPAQRTYIPVAGRQYTGSTIYYVRRFSKIFAAWVSVRTIPGPATSFTPPPPPPHPLPRRSRVIHWGDSFPKSCQKAGLAVYGLVGYRLKRGKVMCEDGPDRGGLPRVWVPPTRSRHECRG